jgi:hypothetical protein
MRYIVGLLVVLFLASCDNELDLVKDFKEVPVVYGLLDRTAETQYIRVERAFADREISPNDIAQNPDSLYYDDITVRLINKRTNGEFILERIDGADEGLPRDEGLFATSPNFLYKVNTVDFPMSEGDSIQLRISNVFEDRDVRATTNIFRPPFFVSPNTLNFERGRQFRLSWNPSDDPTVYSAAFTFDITENRNGEIKDTTLRWVVLNNSERTQLEVEGESFYSFLASSLEENSNITRTMGNGGFELITGNSDVADYIRVGQANLGITSSGEIPIFTNMSEGLGIFGSNVTDRRSGLPFRDSTIDSLINSPITRNLNFQ